MNYHRFLLVAGLLVGGLTALSAQSTPSDPELNADLRGDYENSVLRDRLNNLSTGRSMGPTDVMISQVGSGHQVFVQTEALTGNRPTDVDIMQQGGINNLATLQLTGDGNKLAVTQNGTGNRYVGAVRADDADLSIIQDGNFNDMSQRATLSAETEMQLIQRGDGNVLNADNFATPIRVTQTGGARATLTEVVPGNPR